MCYCTDFAFFLKFIIYFWHKRQKKKRKKIHCQNKENKTIWEWKFAITYPNVDCPSACLCSSKAKSDVEVEHAGLCQVMNWCIKIIVMQVCNRYQPHFNIFML